MTFAERLNLTENLILNDDVLCGCFCRCFAFAPAPWTNRWTTQFRTDVFHEYIVAGIGCVSAIHRLVATAWRVGTQESDWIVVDHT